METGLTIRTEYGDFDTSDGEKIVHTFSIFNLSDFTGRSADYTNEFKLPLTNNNIQIVEFANVVPTILNFPYKKVKCSIIIDDEVFRNGFIKLTQVDEDLICRFFTGNSGFYEELKKYNLPSLEWSDLNHTWSLANAVAGANTSSGYIYPIIDYNGQPPSSNQYYVNRTLPSTFNKTILEKVMDKVGYTYSFDETPTLFNNSITPYTNKNTSYSATDITRCSIEKEAGDNSKNAWSVFITNNNIGTSFFVPYDIISTEANTGYPQFPIYNGNVVSGTASVFDSIANVFTAQETGTYNYSFRYEQSGPLPVPTFTQSGGTAGTITLIDYYVDVEVYVNGVRYDTEGVYNYVKTGTVYLNQGDTIFIKVLRLCRFTHDRPTSAYANLVTVTFPLTYFISMPLNKMEVELQSALAFGNSIDYSLILPKLGSDEWLKDMCVRFGWLLSVDEKIKHVNIFKLDNIDKINYVDWSDKLDETRNPVITFGCENYARKNYIKHKFDKSVLSIPNGTDYTLVIDNENLESEKELYVSPYAPTVNTTLSSESTAHINIYSASTDKFDLDVEPRILYLRPKREDWTYKTESVSGTIVSDVNFAYFIDPDKVNNLGFANSLMPSNSMSLIGILQGLKIIKNDFWLKKSDILNLNFTKAIFINQFQSLFFISSVNQYDYTDNELTEVELIKLN